MPVSDSHRSRIERWVGTVTWTDATTEAEFETWIGRYGEPVVAAIQWLMRKQSDLALAPTRVGSGTDRVDHTANLKAIDARIDDAVSYVWANIDDLALTAEGEALVASAGAGVARETLVVDTVVRSPRRG